MRNKNVCLLLSIYLLTGCTSNSETDASYSLYLSYLETIDSNTSYQNGSAYYTISGELTVTEDGTYAYYLCIDEPTIAMLDIVIVAEDEDTDTSGTMMPSIGIYDGPYNLVPNQVNTEDGYVKGLIVSGESDNDSVKLKMIVEWEDESLNKTREFHHILLTEEGMTYIEESE